MTSDGSCDFDLTGARAESVFFVLGLRSTSGIQEGDDRVESFYCDEQSVAQLFERRLAAMADEQGLANDARRETIQECLTAFRSKMLADRLNSCYEYKLTIPPSAPTSLPARRTSPLRFNAALFHRDGIGTATAGSGLSENAFFRGRALAYLAGVWARFGKGPDFVFPGLSGSPDKAEFIANLLHDLGCRNVRVEHTVGFIPGAWLLHFEPTSEVDEWLRKRW